MGATYGDLPPEIKALAWKRHEEYMKRQCPQPLNSNTLAGLFVFSLAKESYRFWNRIDIKYSKLASSKMKFRYKKPVLKIKLNF